MMHVFSQGMATHYRSSHHKDATCPRCTTKIEEGEWVEAKNSGGHIKYWHANCFREMFV